MEKLVEKLEVADRALQTLEDSLTRYTESADYDETRYKEYRDSLVKRFEYSLDILWKTAKSYLFEVHGVSVASPKPVFRECFSAKLLTESEAEQFLDMVDARNMTSHMYREVIADELYKMIPAYCTLMRILLDQMYAHAKLG